MVPATSKGWLGMCIVRPAGPLQTRLRLKPNNSCCYSIQHAQVLETSQISKLKKLPHLVAQIKVPPPEGATPGGSYMNSKNASCLQCYTYAGYVF